MKVLKTALILSQYAGRKVGIDMRLPSAHKSEMAYLRRADRPGSNGSVREFQFYDYYRGYGITYGTLNQLAQFVNPKQMVWLA